MNRETVGKILFLILFALFLWYLGIGVGSLSENISLRFGLGHKTQKEDWSLEELLQREQGTYERDGAPKEEEVFENSMTEGRELLSLEDDLWEEIQEEYIRKEQEESLGGLTEETKEGGDKLPEEEAEAAVEDKNIQILEAPAWSLAYPMEQLKDFSFLKSYIYQVNKSTQADEKLFDAEKLLAMDMTMKSPEEEGPKILIHHTHASEYFADSDPEDESTLIVGVGDYLARILEETYGISVLHDRTVYPYSEAYSKALIHEEEILAANPSIEVMIDLHRDAAGAGKYTTQIDGKAVANLMFFNGLSRNQKGEISYLPNPNQEENLAFSFQLKMAGDYLYPGLCKRNYLKSYRYNLHVLPKAVIVEVGDNLNTVEEAKNAMEPLAKILYCVLMGERKE